MNIKRYLYLTLGFICVGLAYIGFVTPGIPFSIFLVIAAWAFAKSSKRMEAWLYNHPWFGAFLTNWVNKRVFPQKGKYAMILVMSSTLIFSWFTLYNVNMIIWTGAFMLGVAIWAWRYPGTIEEHDRRIDAGEKIGWIK